MTKKLKEYFPMIRTRKEVNTELTPERIMEVVDDYPEFRKMYEDIYDII